MFCRMRQASSSHWTQYASSFFKNLCCERGVILNMAAMNLRAELTHWISMSGCLSDMLAIGALWEGVLAASSPTRPSGLFNSGRKSSAETGNRNHSKQRDKLTRGDPNCPNTL